MINNFICHLFKIGCLFTFICSYSANAEVMESSKAGFVIEIQAETSASIEDSYAQFLRIGEWWDGRHSWFGSAENFYLEPKVGGCFCEVDGEQQAQHMRVSYVEPNKEIRLLGGLGPLQMMGANGAMSWSFSKTDNGRTSILFKYAVSGYHKDGMDELAPVVDQVQTLQMERLLAKLDQ